jgi:hypothetical protein
MNEIIARHPSGVVIKMDERVRIGHEIARNILRLEPGAWNERNSNGWAG